MKAVHELAQKLYDACPTVKPSWDQIGDVTKSVWIERAQAAAVETTHGAHDTARAADTVAPASALASGEQASLF